MGQVGTKIHPTETQNASNSNSFPWPRLRLWPHPPFPTFCRPLCRPYRPHSYLCSASVAPLAPLHPLTPSGRDPLPPPGWAFRLSVCQQCPHLNFRS